MTPNNWLAPDCSDQSIEASADFGVVLVDAYPTWLSNTDRELKGARILEIGPGAHYAGALGLLARGAASASVSDRWLPPWHSEFHPRVYSRIGAKLRDRGRADDAGIFEHVAQNGLGGVLSEIHASVEELDVGDGAFDLIFSNAVLEHLFDHPRAIEQLSRVTADGGLNLHQIDYRDHRTPDQPLEYLLLTEAEYRATAEAEAEPYSMGCQLRPSEHGALFARHGLEEVYRWPTERAPDDYLASFVPRLRASRSAYRDIDVEALHVTGGLWIWRRA